MANKAGVLAADHTDDVCNANVVNVVVSTVKEAMNISDENFHLAALKDMLYTVEFVCVFRRNLWMRPKNMEIIFSKDFFFVCCWVQRLVVEGNRRIRAVL